MSYDIRLKNRVTNKTLTIDSEHQMRGGTYVVGGTKELELNITYNYARYFYEASDGDVRFEVDGRNAGIRGIYGKSGADTIPMLEDLYRKIESQYKENGIWKKTERQKVFYTDYAGREIDVVSAILEKKPYKEHKEKIFVDEGDTKNYWTDTAANAMIAINQLLTMAKLRPDGVWDGN